MAVEEKYVNQAYLSVTESAANTLTFSKLETGISIYEKVGWLISRIDYVMSLRSDNFAADDDTMQWGLSASDQITSIEYDQNAVIDYNSIKRIDLGTAASGLFARTPLEKDFSMLPGGGLLVPPNPIYIWAKGTALTVASNIKARMFYTVKILKLEEFWELVEQRRMIGG